MDKMREHGVKGVSFGVKYKWRKDSVKIKLESPTYSCTYYGEARDIIQDRAILRQIRKSGLERELSAALLSKLKASKMFAKREPGVGGEERFLAFLLDDEALPVIDFIF
jgi:hypothetical protein